ncbi:MAG: lectin-like protein [Pseudomonadota bacterium]
MKQSLFISLGTVMVLGTGCATGQNINVGEDLNGQNGSDIGQDSDMGPDVGTDTLPYDTLAKDGAIPAGSPGGPCYPNKSCNAGLMCVSGICVWIPDGGTTVDTVPPDTTVDTTAPAVCGNGTQEQGEACDDGNTVDGDQCNANCSLACVGGKTFNLNCYVYVITSSQDMYWHQAVHECEDRGMHLVTTTNAVELAFVRQNLGVPTSTYIWVGLNDMKKEGTWVWITGEPVNYTAWTPGEPSDSLDGEDCAAIWRAQLGWLDHPCISLGHATVCESEPLGTKKVCGNGTKEGAEVCDDGNRNDGDECNAVCLVDCTGGKTFNLNCYVIASPKINWTDGLTYCQSLGMDYASISSDEENLFLDIYRNQVANDHWLWIGFNDQAIEGTWVWQNGESVSYTYWKSYEPSDSPPGEDCAALRRDNEFWYDLPCSPISTNHAAACEQK